MREEIRCRHMGYSFRLTARVILYAPSHRHDSTYHGICYTSRGALAGTRNSSMGPPHEGSIQRPIAPWANAKKERKKKGVNRPHIYLAYAENVCIGFLPRSFVLTTIHLCSILISCVLIFWRPLFPYCSSQWSTTGVTKVCATSISVGWCIYKRTLAVYRKE